MCCCAFRWPTDRAGNLLPGRRAPARHGTGNAHHAGERAAHHGFHIRLQLAAAPGGRPARLLHLPATIREKVRGGYKLWRLVSWFNERHMLWAWLSLFSVGFTDFYIRLCSLGIWTDIRFF